MKKNYKRPTLGIKTIVSFCVLLLIVISVYMVSSYKDCFNQSLSLCLTSKEYRNTTLGFSFRYPNSFPLSKPTEEWEIKQAKEMGYVDTIDFSPKYYFNAGGDRLGYLAVFKDPTTLEQYKAEVLKPKTLNSTAHGEILLPTPQVQEVKIGKDITALKINESNEGNLDTVIAEYVFFKNGLKYQLAFKNSDYAESYKLILSTFKFF